MNQIALAVLAVETGRTIDELAAELGDGIVVDPASGLRMISVQTAADYLEARRAALERRRQAEAQRWAAMRAKPNETRLRVQAIRARQEQLGEPIDGAAFARMMEADGSRDAQLDKAARDRAELTGRVEPTYHRIQED